MHLSQFVSDLTCQHCWKKQDTSQWPTNGDYVPFYYQKEPGTFSLPMVCPHCGKQWYVVWDQDPGPFRRLGMFT